MIRIRRIAGMKIFLVRHGESEGNLGGTLQGCRLDTPLTRRGRRQAEALAVRLAEAEIEFTGRAAHGSRSGRRRLLQRGATGSFRLFQC